MKTRNTKLLSAFLAVMMLFGTVIIPSQAEEAPSAVQFTESDLHELTDYNEAVASGHVNRLTDEEELNTLVFANADNTKSMYFYGEPIKYVDENGVTRDKTNHLTRVTGGYVNADNDIRVILPDLLSSGISLTYEDIEIKMTPAVSAPSSNQITADAEAKPRGQADTLTYGDAFGAGIDLVYTPMYSGLKEDIVLSSYTGETAFNFLLETNGLALTEVNGQYVFVDPDDETSTPLASLSGIRGTRSLPRNRS